MNSPARDAKTIRTTSRSSITVSNQIVCEDEACIGKEANSSAVPTANTVQPEKGNEKPSATSISIGGKEACSDEACIGKT